VHGTADDVILFAGGMNDMGVQYPSAATSVAAFAGYAGCAMTTTAGTALDVAGDATTETTTASHDGCPSGIDVDLWTVTGGAHTTFFKPGPPLLWDWLSAHAKP
jgi:hypothetical protein